jgi:predicted nuclease of predicted toxin-antitoxin system
MLMRLLIDECIDQRLRVLFPDHDCQTAGFARLAGLKNGRLLDAAEAAGFEVLVTVDQNIPDQQNLAGRAGDSGNCRAGLDPSQAKC